MQPPNFREVGFSAIPNIIKPVHTVFCWALITLVCPKPPIILWILCIIQSQWQKFIVLNGKPKNFFSAAPSLGCANFGPMKALGTSQLVPIKSPGTSCCQIYVCPLALDENTLCIAMIGCPDRWCMVMVGVAYWNIRAKVMTDKTAKHTNSFLSTWPCAGAKDRLGWMWPLCNEG